MSKLFSKTGDDVRSLAVAFPARPVAARRFRLRHVMESSAVFLVIILALVVGLLLWSSVAVIDQVVRVEGKIIPAGRSQQIQHLEGGIIAAISTTEGALVKRGDLLLTIDDVNAGANLSETNIKLNSERLTVLRLEAETTNKATLEFPSSLAKLPETEAERNLFLADRAKLEGEIAVHESTIKQHEADIAEAEQRKAQLAVELATATQRLDMINNMAAHGAASKLEILDAQSRQQRLNTEIEEATGAIPKLKAAITEEEARIEAARATFRTQAQDALVTALGEVDRLTQMSTAAADRVKRTEIRSPIDGTINHISVNTVGGVVKPGENIIEIIPKTSDVLVEAHATPRDRGLLHAGLEAQIRISAYDAGEYGLLKGHVTEVSADSMQEPRNGEPYFQVNILVGDIPARYADRAMVPGMTVTADIVTGRRTVLAYLLSPLRKFTYNMFRDPR